MNTATLDLMRDQVRAIYTALTGEQMRAEVDPTQAQAVEVNLDTVSRRFADLHAMARAIPAVAERVPPFSFSPSVDVIDSENEVLVEVALPGVSREEVNVDFAGNQLTVHGVRQGERAADGRIYRHAEIPRGPFHRVVPLPYPIGAPPTVELDRGLVRIRVAKPGKTASESQR